MSSHDVADAHKLARARVVLQADEADGAPARRAQQIVSAFDYSIQTVDRVRRRFVEESP